MDTDIFKIIRKTGYEVKQSPVTIDTLTEYHFAVKSYKILQQFCAHSQKHHKDLLYSEYFVKNLNQNFKHKSPKQQKTEISKYLSVLLEKGRSTEIEIYYNLMFNKVNIKTAKLCLALFYDVRNISEDLYETPQKLLKNIRIDIQRALDIAYGQLKDELAIETFTSSLTEYIENNGANKSYIPGSVMVNLVIIAYLTSHNYLNSVDYTTTPLWLDWSTNNTNVFTVKANKMNKSANKSNNDEDHGKLTGEQNGKNTEQGPDGKADKDEFLLGKSDGNSNLVKICHPFVFNTRGIEDSSHKDEGKDIRKDILALRNRLEKQKVEHVLHQNMWKLILHHLKESFQHYDIPEDEFESIERINETLSGVLSRNTEEWRSIFHEKKEYRLQNCKYLYTIGCLLEGLDQNLHKDLRALDLSDNESRPVVSLFEKLQSIDFSRYFDTNDQTAEPKEDANAEDVQKYEAEHSGPLAFNSLKVKEDAVNYLKGDQYRKISACTIDHYQPEATKEVKGRSNTFVNKLPQEPEITDAHAIAEAPMLDSRQEDKVSQLKANLGKVKEKFTQSSLKK